MIIHIIYGILNIYIYVYVHIIEHFHNLYISRSVFGISIYVCGLLILKYLGQMESIPCDC